MAPGAPPETEGWTMKSNLDKIKLKKEIVLTQNFEQILK